MRKGILFIFMLLISGSISYGQTFYDWKIERSWTASLGVGTATYFGDIDSDFNFSPSAFQFAMRYKTPVNRLFGRAEFSVYSIEGTDIGTPNEGRGGEFESTNFELALIASYYLWPTNDPYYARRIFNPYAFAGLGVTYFNPKAVVNGEKQALQPLMTEGVKYDRIAGVLPFGVGASFQINYIFDISIEGGMRYTFTDFLDDMSERGNPDSKDWYWIMAIKLELYLPYDLFRKTGNKPKVKTFRKFKDTLWID